MHAFQYWLFHALRRMDWTVGFMHSKWGWPMAQILHFLGLSLLIGTIFMFDLRLLGMARGIPIAALHKLVRWGVGGFLLNALTGFLFLTATPDQYVYNSAFQWKVLFLLLAGLNVGVFYGFAFRRTRQAPAGAHTPLLAKAAAISSISLWTGVIVMGRMIAFHRPYVCPPNAVIGFVATCFTKK